MTLSTSGLSSSPIKRYDDTTVYRHLAEQHPRVTIVEGVFLDQLLPACDVAL